MSEYVFGKDILYNLFTYEDGEKITALPTQTVTGYIFRPQPDRAAALAGTGAISSFTQSLTAGDDIQLTIPAVSDPDPTGGVTHYTYWVAVNFVLKTGGQVQTVLRAIEIYRVFGQDSDIGVTTSKVIEVFPDITAYITTSQIESMIALARAEIVADLDNKGMQWASIHEPKQLYHALLFNSLFYVFGSQGERFEAQAQSAKQSYENTKRALRLSYDTSQTGQQAEVRRTGGPLFVVR